MEIEMTLFFAIELSLRLEWNPRNVDTIKINVTH